MGREDMVSYLNSVDFAFQYQAALAKGVTTTLPRGIPVPTAGRGR